MRQGRKFLVVLNFILFIERNKKRKSISQAKEEEISCYSKTLCFEELFTAQKIRKHLLLKVEIDSSRVRLGRKGRLKREREQTIRSLCCNLIQAALLKFFTAAARAPIVSSHASMRF